MQPKYIQVIYVFASPTGGSKKPLRGNDFMVKVLEYVPELKSPERMFQGASEVLPNSFPSCKPC